MEQNIEQDNTSQSISKKNKQIPSWVGFIFIAITAIIFFGGVFAYQNYFIEHLPTVQTGEIVGWKTYTNEKYGFEIGYPSDWVIKENKISFGNSIYLSKDGYELSIGVSDLDWIGEGIVTAQDAVKAYIFLNPIVGKKIWRDIIPHLPEESTRGGVYGFDISFPELNMGSSSADYKYKYFHNIKNADTTYSFSYFLPKGITDVNYDKNTVKQMDQILSTFKFTTPVDQTTGWKTFDSVDGFEFKYPVIKSYIALNEPEIIRGNSEINGNGCFMGNNNGRYANSVVEKGKILVNGKQFCLSETSDSAMGHSYPTLFYSTTYKDGNYFTVAFSFDVTACGNLKGGPDYKLCQDFISNPSNSTDKIANNIISTFIFF